MRHWKGFPRRRGRPLGGELALGRHGNSKGTLRQVFEIFRGRKYFLVKFAKRCLDTSVQKITTRADNSFRPHKRTVVLPGTNRRPGGTSGAVGPDSGAVGGTRGGGGQGAGRTQPRNSVQKCIIRRLYAITSYPESMKLIGRSGPRGLPDTPADPLPEHHLGYQLHTHQTYDPQTTQEGAQG